MIEVDLETDRGFAYGTDSLELLKRHPYEGYKIERVERLSGVSVYTVVIPGVSVEKQDFSLIRLGEISCRHGEKINYKSINRLPQEGWQELIDCWSCHNNEFQSMLNLKMRPRQMGILTSNFYLVAHEGMLPPCCCRETKIFYNDFIIKYSHRNFIYKFFEEYFESKNCIVLEHGGKNREIKYFYKCVLISGEACDAIKVGVRETDKPCTCDEFINGFFRNKIFEEISENAIDIQVLKYEISFIKQK